VSNNLGLAGAQTSKQTRYAPIYTGRWSSGLWTNRSPLRDATTSRIAEKFYGQAGDALIGGLNTEVTNKLTLARRPGSSIFDSNTWTDLDRYYEFRLFNASTEEIILMVDQQNALYSLIGGTKTLVFNKTTNGQAYMQSVGNSLYFGDGQDNKKWLQTLSTWSAGAKWGTGSSPMFTTYLIDGNGNLQQLTGTQFAITNIAIVSGVLTVTSTDPLNTLFVSGNIVTFPATLAATFLENQVVTISTVTSTTFTATFSHADYSGAETGKFGLGVGQGTPISGGSTPTWSTQVPAAGNDFAGGVTIDGTVQWTNRGTPLENWGITAPTSAVSPSLGPAFNANWTADTFYSLASVIVDTNGNLQQVTTAGKSTGSAPTWATSVASTTTDGTVTWTMVQTAAQLVWQSAYAYKTPFTITSVASPIGTDAVYTGIISGGASNAYAGLDFLVTGFPDLANNGIFNCTASTDTTLTLTNGSAIAQNATNTSTACQWISIQYVIGNAAGTDCLFKLTPSSQLSLSTTVSAYLYPVSHSGPVGSFVKTYPTTTGSASESATGLTSLQFAGAPLGTGATLKWSTINGAGQLTGTTTPFSATDNYNLIILGSMAVPVAGTYTISVTHHDGMFWGMGGGATLISGPSYNPQGQTQTANQGYPIFGGTNAPGLGGGGSYNSSTNTWTGAPLYTDVFTVNFPTAGVYPFEFDYDYWYHSGQQFNVLCNGNVLISSSPVSGSTTPSWPGFSTSFAPNYATASEAAGNILWSNIGPTTDFAWAADKNFTLPNAIITDTNGYFEAPFRSGFTASTKPTFNTGLYNLTNDNPNLIWINEGIASSLPSGTISTFNGGWEYAIALVNTLDNTVSNCGPPSTATGNFVSLASVNLAPGDGLPPLDSIDPQVDYVAIFRTVDGGSTPFLIPGDSTTYTLPLSDYITNGYTDDTPDNELNNLISGAIAGENTPPLPGAINLTYHLNRIWYSIGNVVYWTTGPATPVGNGINGTSPLNFDSLPSLIKRIVPTSSGVLIFTVSDIYIIQGNGTSGNPIQSALPLIPGVGLLSYNALDMNGPTIGFFTTDNQFIILDPSSGVSYVGFPIGDQLRLNNGNPGQSWNPSNVYVTWHVEGEDQGWYLCDGVNGFYRLMSTPAPETGYTWSPFAAITGGCKAVQSVEVSPGVHRLLIGPYTSGNILKRDLSVFTDNGTPYNAWAMVGSAVLTQPGQVAEILFIATDAVKVGTPLQLGILVDDALPYYTGPIDMLQNYVEDPPNLKHSRSFWSQRFYLDDAREEASAMRHCQIKVQFNPNDIVQNELLTMTLFGSYSQEV
jgi:hypothetical protein